MLTTGRAREDYVKAIYQLGDGAPIPAAALARYLCISRAAITKFRRVLERDGLVKPATARVDRLDLTPRGHALAVGMVRRHRLVETFLHRALGMPLDEVHAQAEAIEHAISDDVADRLERFLGNPAADPHGHPIEPRRARKRAVSVLADAPEGSRVRIEGIPDRDPAVIRRLIAQGVLPGLVAEVTASGQRTIGLRSESRRHVVSTATAAKIQVRVGPPRGRG